MVHYRPINGDDHDSGDSAESPEKGAYAPSPNPLRLLPEGHNLHRSHSKVCDLFQGDSFYGYTWVGPRLPLSAHEKGDHLVRVDPPWGTSFELPLPEDSSHFPPDWGMGTLLRFTPPGGG